MSLTLYKLDASPPARAAMMVVELLQVPGIKLQDINLFAGDHLKEEYLKLNPQHTVPTLVDGDFAVWDSHAIAAYLVGAYGKDDNLYPKDLKRRALVDQRLHFDSGVLFPALITAIKDVVWKGAKAYKPEDLERIGQSYELLEKFLTGRKWLTGDHLTIGDICCVATVSSANEVLPIDSAKFPNSIRWINQFSGLDFFEKANKPGLKGLADFLRSKLQ